MPNIILVLSPNIASSQSRISVLGGFTFFINYLRLKYRNSLRNGELRIKTEDNCSTELFKSDTLNNPLLL